MNPDVLIGIAGPEASGKDTFSLKLNAMMGLKIDRFAAPIYEMAAKVDPVFQPNMTHADKQDYVLGDARLGRRRDFLRKLGTGFGRNTINSKLWELLLDYRVEASRAAGSGVVVADVRMPSEAELILERGGIVLELCPDWTTYSKEHPTDEGLPRHLVTAQIKLTKGVIEAGTQAIISAVTAHLRSVL